MNIEDIRNYCIAKPHTEESLPFGPDNLVFKVGGKIYLLLGFDTEPLQFNVKCDPAEAIDLREEFPNSVLPGYHMNKKHWNTVRCTGEIPLNRIFEMIDKSYALVLPKSLV